MNNERDVYWEDLHVSLDGDLQGKVAIVTGGGRGIGLAIVRNFLRNGARVVIVSRESGQDFAQTHEHCVHMKCDVREVASVRRVVEATVAAFGGIDILVNCAGYAFLTPVREESEELFDTIMDTNFKGGRNFIVHTLPYLEKTKGVVMSMASIWAQPGVNLPGDATYSAADAARIKYAEVVAEEVVCVRVNTISAALVDTEMNNDMSQEAKDEFARAYKDRDTLFTPDEIAVVAEYIAKSDVHQKNIIIDAGYTR